MRRVRCSGRRGIRRLARHFAHGQLPSVTTREMVTASTYCPGLKTRMISIVRSPSRLMLPHRFVKRSPTRGVRNGRVGRLIRIASAGVDASRARTCSSDDDRECGDAARAYAHRTGRCPICRECADASAIGFFADSDSRSSRASLVDHGDQLRPNIFGKRQNEFMRERSKLDGLVE